MKKSRKLIFICLLGLIATACSSNSIRKDSESEDSVLNNKQSNFIHHQIGRSDQ